MYEKSIPGFDGYVPPLAGPGEAIWPPSILSWSSGLQRAHARKETSPVGADATWRCRGPPMDQLSTAKCTFSLPLWRLSWARLSWESKQDGPFQGSVPRCCTPLPMSPHFTSSTLEY